MTDGEQKLDKYYYDLFFPPVDPRENSFNSTLLFVGGMASMAAVGNAVGRNVYKLGRPMWAGIHVTVGCSLLAGLAGECIRRTMISYNDYCTRRMFHYMTLHPELFPPPARTKFADYFCEWEHTR